MAQDTGFSSPIPSNLEVMRAVAGRIGRSVGQQIHEADSISVAVVVYPLDHAWYIERALLEEMQQRGFRVTAGTGSNYLMEFGLSNLKVEYSNVRRNGLFGPRVLDRKIIVQMSVKIVPVDPMGAVIANEFLEENRDTILVSEVQTVESPALPVTHGTIPPESFFSHFAEPLVMIGALAVGIYLLFTVRS